jgi:hypothetical protein
MDNTAFPPPLWGDNTTAFIYWATTTFSAAFFIGQFAPFTTSLINDTMIGKCEPTIGTDAPGTSA